MSEQLDFRKWQERRDGAAVLLGFGVVFLFIGLGSFIGFLARGHGLTAWLSYWFLPLSIVVACPLVFWGLRLAELARKNPPYKDRDLD